MWRTTTRHGGGLVSAGGRRPRRCASGCGMRGARREATGCRLGRARELRRRRRELVHTIEVLKAAGVSPRGSVTCYATALRVQHWASRKARSVASRHPTVLSCQAAIARSSSCWWCRWTGGLREGEPPGFMHTSQVGRARYVRRGTTGRPGRCGVAHGWWRRAQMGRHGPGPAQRDEVSLPDDVTKPWPSGARSCGTGPRRPAVPPHHKPCGGKGNRTRPAPTLTPQFPKLLR
jgi:hypothetical protein